MATTYYEIIVKGDDKILKGFIRGFQIGRSLKSGVWVARDHPIDTEHLKERLTFRGDRLHLIATAAARRRLIAAIEEAQELGFEIVEDRKVTLARFAFEFDTFNREVASRIKNLMESAPTGLRLINYDPQEKVDKRGHGVELYSPLHEYQFCGKGEVQGDFEAVLAFRAKLESEEFIEAGDIDIEH